MTSEWKWLTRALARALGQLEKTREAGRVARGNARREVLLQLRRVRRMMNNEFPAIPAKGTKTPLRKLTKAGFERRMKARDFIEVSADHIARKLLEARVPLVRARDSDPLGKPVYWAPRWAVVVAAYGDVTKIRRAQRAWLRLLWG